MPIANILSRTCVVLSMALVLTNVTNAQTADAEQADEQVRLRRPVEVQFENADGEDIVGQLVQFNLQGFTLGQEPDPVRTFVWHDLSVDDVVLVFGSGMRPNFATP